MVWNDLGVAWALPFYSQGLEGIRETLPVVRVQPGSPYGLPAPYPTPGAFTRPLPDSWGLPDSYRSKNQLKITFFGLKRPKFLSQ